MRVTLRPLPEWPYAATSPRRNAQFKSGTRRAPGGDGYIPGRRIGYDQTLRELEYEIDQLDGDDVVIGVGLEARDIRLDGAPRADARAVRHPGVEVSFNSRFGRLTYATDVFTDWRDNVRAVTKGLEALRAIDRWGVAKRGQQYTGFALLTAGPGREERARQLIAEHGSVPAALRATHPDTGGATANVDDFQALVAYRNSLQEGG